METANNTPKTKAIRVLTTKKIWYLIALFATVCVASLLFNLDEWRIYLMLGLSSVVPSVVFLLQAKDANQNYVPLSHVLKVCGLASAGAALVAILLVVLGFRFIDALGVFLIEAIYLVSAVFGLLFYSTIALFCSTKQSAE